MKLTDAEIEYTRQVAAEIGADPEALIAEGEQIKEAGYRQAYEASVAILGSRHSNQMIGPSPHLAWEAKAEVEAEPELEAG